MFVLMMLQLNLRLFTRKSRQYLFPTNLRSYDFMMMFKCGVLFGGRKGGGGGVRNDSG